MIIFYVTDQKWSAEFYENVFEMKPVLDVPGMTEFRISDSLSLGLMPGDGIKQLLGDAIEHPFLHGNSIPRAELYLMVDFPEIWMERAIQAGAEVVSPLSERDWGDLAGYVKGS
ncbi:MAG: lactoylglutathione lyase [Candidatus Marinimicrobia bacterium]|nr:lactoylglutathione lyase [Candidatus Neomarinimicrobiota bacterium]